MTELTGYREDAEIEAVARKLEACEYGKTEFAHAMHLAVAAWYLTHFSREEALARMRASLLRFTEHHQVRAYHETITRFWMIRVEEFLHSTPADECFVERVNRLVRRYEDKNILFEYYTRERVMSDEARQVWLEPDLAPERAESASVASDAAPGKPSLGDRFLGKPTKCEG
jgi:hypothetical protein